MTDPIHRPLTEDAVYADEPQAPIAPAAKAVADARQRKLDRERAELGAVLSTDAGQAVVMRLLDLCGVHLRYEKATDLATYASCEGRRSVGLWLIEQIARIGPEVYPHLLLHHAKRLRSQADLDAGIARNSKP